METKISEQELIRRNNNLIYNIELLIKLTGTSTRSFLEYAGGFGKSTFYTCKLNNTYVPKYEAIEPIATKFQTTVDVLLNEKLPENFCINPIKVFRAAIINSDEDNKLAELLGSFYEKDFATIISIFAKQNCSVEFIISPDIMLMPDIKPYKPTNSSLKKQYNDLYNEEKIANAHKGIPAKIKNKSKKQFAKYKDYYLPIFERKLTFINAFESFSQKYGDDIFKYVKIRIKTPKMQTLPDDAEIKTDEEKDIYDTLKNITLEKFIEYCDKYYNQINKVFRI